jgi:hypothetical protein
MSDFHNPFFAFVEGITVPTNKMCDYIVKAKVEGNKVLYNELKKEQKRHHAWLTTTHDANSIRKREWRNRRNDT